MSKNKYTAPNNNISEFIYNEYLCDSDLCKEDMLYDKIDILIANNLAYKISGTDFLTMKYDITYRVACKFIQKYNKINKNYRRKITDYEFGGKHSFCENNNKELMDLTKYSLSEGSYYCQMDDSNYAKLQVKFGSIDSDQSLMQVNYVFYLIGRDWKKWRDIFNEMLDSYAVIEDASKEEYIYYTDGRPRVNAIFKPFSQIILKDKERLIQYIDNFISNIPVYYDKYNMISKLSILLYGKPGTGKSTVAKAIAKHLGIKNVTSVSPDYFDSQVSQSSRNDRSYSTGKETVHIIDDIDCICKSREESQDKENAETLSMLLSFLDNPPTFYYKTKDGLSYPISIVIATTNYYDKLDEAIKRYGRFDLKIGMDDFNKREAEEMCKLYDLRLVDIVGEYNNDFTISPSYLQALCLENIDKSLKMI